MEIKKKGTNVWHKKLFAIVKAKWHRFCVAANLISPSRSFAVFLSHQKINHPRSTFHLICVNNGTPCEAERVEVQTTGFAWTADESNWLRRKFSPKEENWEKIHKFHSTFMFKSNHIVYFSDVRQNNCKQWNLIKFIFIHSRVCGNKHEKTNWKRW